MKSIASHLRPVDICAQIRMERQIHKGAFLLVEGSTDIRRFRKFYNDAGVSFVNCLGKENVLGVVEIEQNSGRMDCLGFVDADFDRLHGVEIDDDGVIWSKNHDFDLDVCSTAAVGRYLQEMAQATKLSAYGGVEQCVARLLEALKPLSALRYANVRHGLRYDLESVDLAEFFDGASIDIDGMIDHVSGRRFNTAECKAALRSRIDQYASANMDLWQFTNGHDFVAALGIALRDTLGNRRIPQTWRNEVEKHLRLAFDVEDFLETGHLERIRTWANDQEFVGLLKPHLN